MLHALTTPVYLTLTDLMGNVILKIPTVDWITCQSVAQQYMMAMAFKVTYFCSF